MARIPRRRTGLAHACAVVFLAAAALAPVACSGDTERSASTTLATVAPEATTTTEPPLEAGRQVFVYTPAVGQCFDRRRLEERPESGPQQTDVVLLLDCALPHENEVFAVLDMPGTGPVFPGEPAMEEFARRNCASSFAPYVGRSYETSELEIGYYLPSSNEWDAGSRRLGCYVYVIDGDKLVGSAAGSGR